MDGGAWYPALLQGIFLTWARAHCFTADPQDEGKLGVALESLQGLRDLT